MSVMRFQSGGTLAAVQIKVKNKYSREMHEDIDAFISTEIRSTSGIFPILNFVHDSRVSLAKGESVQICRGRCQYLKCQGALLVVVCSVIFPNGVSVLHGLQSVLSLPWIFYRPISICRLFPYGILVIWYPALEYLLFAASCACSPLRSRNFRLSARALFLKAFSVLCCSF